MIVIAGLCGAVTAYLWGVARALRVRRRAPFWRSVAFVAGCAAIGGVLIGPFDDLADGSLAWHMAQHLVLLEIAMPLVILGAPHRIALAALPARQARALARALASKPLAFVTQPALAWLQFQVVLFVTHFSPWYEASLENATLHAAMHALYLLSATVFWWPILAVAPAPHAPSHPVRLLMTFTAMPAGAFLGFVLYASTHVWYAHYAGQPNALDDQRTAGALMWIAGSGPLLVALLWLVADWAACERRLALVLDARLAAAGSRP